MSMTLLIFSPSEFQVSLKKKKWGETHSIGMSELSENAEVSLNASTVYTSYFLWPITDPCAEIFCDAWEAKKNLAQRNMALLERTGKFMCNKTIHIATSLVMTKHYCNYSSITPIKQSQGTITSPNFQEMKASHRFLCHNDSAL